MPIHMYAALASRVRDGGEVTEKTWTAGTLCRYGPRNAPKRFWLGRIGHTGRPTAAAVIKNPECVSSTPLLNATLSGQEKEITLKLSLINLRLFVCTANEMVLFLRERLPILVLYGRLHHLTCGRCQSAEE